MSNLKYLHFIGLICAVSIINGCMTPSPTFVDFIGTWTAKDGCKIYLNRDSTCIVEKLNIGILNSHIEESVCNFTGNWSFRAASDFEYEEFNIVIESDSIYFKESFIISGQGLLKDMPPWYFFQYIGDPDDLNRYIFTKIE